MILLPFHFLRLTGLKTALYDKSYSQQSKRDNNKKMPPSLKARQHPAKINPKLNLYTDQLPR